MNPKTELEVPEASATALGELTVLSGLHGSIADVVRAIAEPVVVAELWRLLVEADRTSTPLGALVVTRADELEAGAR